MIDEHCITRQQWAADLLSQQVWCWGQDVKRPDGNWLTETGFLRKKPPENRKDCSSVYTLEISTTTRIVLRGFGVFIGDDSTGGLFVERYGFTPKFSTKTKLDCPPWSDKDMPLFERPLPDQRYGCMLLLLRLLDWIRQYETDVATKLGIDYRRQTLIQWNNGKRRFIPAEQIGSAWRRLSHMIAADPLTWLGRRVPTNDTVQ